MLQISTKDFSARKKVLIDDHEYSVRRFGNIEQLDMSQYMRRLKKLADIEKSTKLTEAQELEVEELGSKVTMMFVNLFDDGGDQTKSRELIASLSDTELTAMLDQIFEEAKPNETEVS